MALAAAGGAGAEYLALAPALPVGMAIAVVGGVVHLVVWLKRRTRVLERRVRELTHDIEELRIEAEATRADLETLHLRFDDMPDADKLSSELKVLGGLLKQLSEKKEAAVTGKALAAPDGKAGAGSGSAEIKRSTAPTIVLGEAQLLEAIERGLREEKVELYIQPVVTLPQRRRRFYECYSRIVTDGGGVILPEQYIPVAERAGLMAAIDNLLLVRCVQIVRRARRDQPDVGFFCNISSASLTDADFFQDFIGFMAENKQLAETLIFEFDQASIDAGDYLTRVNLQRLRGFGYRFSLDQVTDMDLDLPDLASQGFRYIKVGAHMLHELARGDDPILDMRALKGALDRNAMDLIVEKIESEDMLLDLLELRVDFGQGYLFGEPRPLAGTG
ncbi:EAL domain-containing protein [Thalassobaculum sp.]|uniref:EAL domain-containing protein n=1 Tax=Thalassobaculum sp. TaxID=2022740 RepID=UPI0032EC7969